MLLPLCLALVTSSCLTVQEASVSTQLPTAEAVLAKVRAARGLVGHAPIENCLTKGRFTLTGTDGEGTFEEIMAGRRMHSRSEFPGWGVYEMGSDGEVLWEANPLTGVTIKTGAEEESARRMCAFFGPGDWSESYSEGTCTGVEALGARPHYRLELMTKNGAKDVWLVDTETHLPGRIDALIQDDMGQEIEMQLRLSDWKTVDGLQYPMRREMKAGLTFVYFYDTLEHDVELPEDYFALPEKVRAALASPASTPAASGFELKELKEQHIMAVRVKCKTAEIGRQMAILYPEVLNYLNQAGVRPSGAPMARYFAFGPDEVEFEAGMPVAKPEAGNARVKPQKLPAGKVATGWHTGPYEKLPETYARLAAWIQEQGLESGTGQWEVYWTDPGIEPNAAKWRTQIFWPIAKE